MKRHLIIAGLSALLTIATSGAEDQARKDALAKHREGVEKIADEQDELSADVQQLVVEQTMPQVIKLLGEVEVIMDETTDRLSEADTGGGTIAAQTEILEKIHAAAKERQSQGDGGGKSKSGGAMMDMMERMMGKKPEDAKKGQGQAGKPADEGSNGQTGLSDAGNAAAGDQGGGKSEARRVPKAGGGASLEIPEEFRKALDAYNRGAEQKVK
jgi:hypothetical protein